MEFGDDLKASVQFSTEAMRLMARYKIPVTPQNFAVWYAYVSDQGPDLKKAVDVLISNNQEFSEEQNAELFDKYFGQQAEGVAIQQTGEEMARLLGHVRDMVSQATDEAQVFGAALADGVGSLTGNKEVKNVGAVLKVLAGETQRMLERNQQLEQKLQNSSQEIEALKENLESVQKEAQTDGLTGLANRKMFDMVLRHEMMEAMENGTPLCLLMCDIDHFKNFNDTHGHITGDHVLRFVGAMLTDLVTPGATPARYGGEEFAVILPNADIYAAAGLADTVRTAVCSKRLRKKQSSEEIGSITLSLGVALFRPGEPAAAFIKRADDGLYQAKNSGRNRVVAETELNSAAD
ncbi:MAG: diguanylate cyclase [Alphaproteobacteria bacterium]|nr:diguanylate cyclase [Alphaproteobacteria bacterium]